MRPQKPTLWSASLTPIRALAQQETRRRRALCQARVVPDGVRCIQCGVCSYNCPVGIDIRGYAWRREAVSDGWCIACGECVARCPRGALQFESIACLP